MFITLGAFVLLGHLPQKYVAIVAELQPLFKSIVLLILVSFSVDVFLRFQSLDPSCCLFLFICLIP